MHSQLASDRSKPAERPMRWPRADFVAQVLAGLWVDQTKEKAPGRGASDLLRRCRARHLDMTV